MDFKYNDLVFVTENDSLGKLIYHIKDKIRHIQQNKQDKHVYCTNCINFDSILNCDSYKYDGNEKCKACVCKDCDCFNFEDSTNIPNRPKYIERCNIWNM